LNEGVRLRRWADAALAAVLLGAGLLVAARFPAGRTLDAGGVLLLSATVVPLVVRRRWPLPVLGVHLAALVPFHALDYQHEAVVPGTIVALYTVAARGPRRRTVLVGLVTVGFAALGILAFSEDADDPQVVNVLSALGWVVAAVVAGEAVRLHRAYLAEVLDRAERAERSRDEEARRQVAEERLRIARDLHDLLAHSITVIHVEAGVASHLIGDRGVDQQALLTSLDVITAACAEARGELTATLGLLREAGPAGDDRQPAPRLAELPALARAAEAAGIEVGFSTRGTARDLPPEVELVAYRIVQEALTNVVKHSGAGRADVVLDYGDDRLGLEVTDDGRGSSGGSGFGTGGMRERATALGGSLTAGPAEGGYAVTATLPVRGRT
jgi:signal transduction histidine kinase